MQKITNDIKDGTFAHAYLLFGEERYLKKQYTDRLRQAMCAPDDTMNTHFYHGKGIPVDEIIDLAETLPFLAERRVIFISESGLFKAGGDKLAEYLSSPADSTYFVFTESELDKRSKLYKAVQKNGHIAEFQAQTEQTLKRWIAGRLGREGKRITENTVQIFLEKTGTDMENIEMELEKLICYCLDRDIVTTEDVETICTHQVTGHIFDMIDAISVGDRRRALQLYYDLLELREPPMRILTLIGRQCNKLLLAKEMRSRGYDNQAIAPQLGVPPFIAGKYIRQAGRFKTAALRSAVEQCVEADAAIKGGRMDDQLSVELLIMTVLPGDAGR